MSVQTKLSPYPIGGLALLLTYAFFPRRMLRGVVLVALFLLQIASLFGAVRYSLPRPFDRRELYDSHARFHNTLRELAGSQLLSVDWSEHLPNPYCEVVVTVRADGAPSWGADPEKDDTLYVFNDPKAPNPLGVRANRIELRLAPTFKTDAFYADGWKQPAIVGGLRVRYRQPTRSLRREERKE